MAGSRTGTPTIWKLTTKIVRLKQKFGASDMTEALGSEFTACIDALIACAIAVMATDDYVLQIDNTAPAGPEDL